MQNNKIIIGGDVSFDQVKVDEYALSGLSKLSSFLGEAEYSIVNLECPITNSREKINKIGPNIKCGTNDGTKLLSALNLTHVTLANNHIMDYGYEGLKDTIELCNSLNIETFGAGINSEQASAISAIILSNEKKIAIINACEKEFCISDLNKPGAAHCNVIDMYHRITEAKKNNDEVVVILHGGHEHYKYVSPEYQKKLRFFAELGVSAIISHHTHFASGYEIWAGCPIFYSLGNLIFSRENYKDYWYHGYLVTLDFSEEKISFELTPYRQGKKNNLFEFIAGDEKEKYLKDIHEINNVLQNRELLMDLWTKYVHKNEYAYFCWVNGLNRLQRMILKKIGIIRFIKFGLSNSKKQLRLWQLINCESHKEMTEKVLEVVNDDIRRN